MKKNIISCEIAGSTQIMMAFPDKDNILTNVDLLKEDLNNEVFSIKNNFSYKNQKEINICRMGSLSEYCEEKPPMGRTKQQHALILKLNKKKDFK